MGTGIALREIPTPTPQHDKSLSPQELEDHRAAIAFEVKVVLSAMFQPHETEEIKAAQLAWWCDKMQEWTLEQVVWALREWNDRFPSIRPTPGHIRKICKEARGKKHAVKSAPPPEPDRVRVTAERAAEITQEYGFRPKTFGGNDDE